MTLSKEGDAAPSKYISILYRVVYSYFKTCTAAPPFNLSESQKTRGPGLTTHNCDILFPCQVTTTNVVYYSKRGVYEKVSRLSEVSQGIHRTLEALDGMLPPPC